MRVPEPRPVQVHGDPGLGGPGPQRLQLGERLDRPAAEVVGVLHRDRGGRHQVRPGVGGHEGQRHRRLERPGGVAAVDEPVGPGPRGDPAERPVPAELGPQHVGQHVGEQLLPRLDEQPDPDHVGHRAGGEEQPGLVPEQRGRAGLELEQGRVLGVHVVAHDGRGHGLAHGRRRRGQGVRAEVDDRDGRACRSGGGAHFCPSISATRKAISRLCWWLSRGSQTDS